jgi:hypothetical protein
MLMQLPIADSRVAALGICLAVALTILGSSGCGRSSLVRVSGRVAYSDGSPVPVGRVLVDTRGKPMGAWGRIKPDGRFTIGTLELNDGIAPGTYRVAIVDAGGSGPDGRGKLFVSPQFSDFDTSGLEFKVPEQTDWQIVVEPPADRGRK